MAETCAKNKANFDSDFELVLKLFSFDLSLHLYGDLQCIVGILAPLVQIG